MKKWSDYFTKEGLVFNGDQGDSARETGTYIVALEKQHGREIMWDCLAKCYTSKGWVRSPYVPGWISDPKEFSRDQWTGVMCALIMVMPYLPAQEVLKDTLHEQDRRPFSAPNGDIITWEWALYIRALKMGGTPFLYLLDWGLLLNVIIRVVKSYLDEFDTADDINVATMCYVFNKNQPTLWVRLAVLIYRLRKHSVKWAWQQYYSRPEAPPMDVLWEPIFHDLRWD